MTCVPATALFWLPEKDQKEDPLDFVLWKPKKEGEPYWKSPWSDGTSRMAYRVLCNVEEVSRRAN